MRLIWLLPLILVSLVSGCHKTVPSIIQTGDCERGIVTSKNIDDTKKIWKDAEITDVLIGGGCYQKKFIKKGG